MNVTKGISKYEKWRNVEGKRIRLYIISRNEVNEINIYVFLPNINLCIEGRDYRNFPKFIAC